MKSRLVAVNGECQRIVGRSGFWHLGRLVCSEVKLLDKASCMTYSDLEDVHFIPDSRDNDPAILEHDRCMLVLWFYWECFFNPRLEGSISDGPRLSDLGSTRVLSLGARCSEKKVH